MRRADGSRARQKRPSTAKLLVGQVVYQLRLLLRSPIAAFATLVIPLMVLLAVNLLFSATRLSTRGGIRFAQFFTPAMVAFAVVNACYMSVISSTTLARDAGILKRIRATPLPPWAYMAGRIISACVVATISAIVVIAVGSWVYGFQMVWSGVPGALLTLVVAMFCFSALGLAVTVLVPAADSALPIAWGTILPLCFISDVFQPIDTAPHWLRVVASAFPVRPFADDLEAALNPVTVHAAVRWDHLGVLLAWGVAAAVFALLKFRWEPDGHRRERRSRRSTAAAAARGPERLESRPGPGRPAAPMTPVRPEPGRAPAGWAGVDREAGAEQIEGPAPSEDSSVPPDPVRERETTSPVGRSRC